MPDQLREALELEAQGKAACTRNAYLDALAFYEQALHIREQVLGPEHADLVPLLTALGHVEQTLAHDAKAETLYRRALTICESTYGPNDLRTIGAIGDVAGILDQMKKNEQAQPLYEEAVRLAEEQAGPDHPDTALALSKAARFYRIINAPTQAEQCFQRALTIYERLPPGDHSAHMATCLNNLAYLKIQLAQYVEAETLLRRALQMNTEEEGQLRAGANLKNLAIAFHAQGQIVLGTLCGKQALSIYEQALGKEHPDTVALASTLA